MSTITNSDHQGSVLGQLLFLTYINDLVLVKKNCKVHYFADDTNLLDINKSPKRLNDSINVDLRNLTKSLNTNKITSQKQKWFCSDQKGKVCSSILK